MSNTNGDVTLMPRESGKFIAERSKHVQIINNNIEKLEIQLVKAFEEKQFTLKNFSECEFHPDKNDPRTPNWLLVIDALNFSFWNDSKDEKWTFAGQSGYYALCAAIKKAIDNGIPITDANYLSKITRDELRDILHDSKCKGKIFLLDERVENLHQVGHALNEKFNGSFAECIKICDKSAEKLLKLIIKEFPSFRDESIYDGQRVAFLKRAQILVGDLWACYQGQGLGDFTDIKYLTMFADYRVPQVLVHFGILKYSDELIKKLSLDETLEAGSAEEAEIRGCSIEAVDRVVEAVLNSKDINDKCDLTYFNAVTLDHFLWDYRRKYAKELEPIPYHKTRTIFY